MFKSPVRGFSRVHAPSLCFAAVLLALCFLVSQNWELLGADTSNGLRLSQRVLQVAVVNTPLSHDEVIVPLLEAFTEIPHASVNLYHAGYRFGMDELLEQQGFPKSLRDSIHVGEFRDIGKDSRHPIPDIVVSTTCMDDMKLLQGNFTTLLERHHTHIFCVVHHSDRMREEKWKVETLFTPWIRADRMDLVTLSGHVADDIQREHLQRHWDVVKVEKHEPKLRVFPPVFRFDTASVSGEGSSRESGFAIQGEYQRGRDYPLIFDQLRKFIENAKSRGESADRTNLHLVGFGLHPEVPKELQHNVVFDERLNYLDYYTTIAQTDAVVTAFDSDEYYHLKASSSVPAALIAGTPLVANAQLLQTYAYLNSTVIWQQEEHESELDVIGRVLAMSVEERAEKKRAVKDFTAELIRKNKAAVRGWVAEAVQHFPPDWYSHRTF